MQYIKIGFAILSVIICLFAFYQYIRDIFLRRTEPHVYTWFIWIITQGTAFAGILYGKGELGSVGLGVSMALVVFVFILSLKYGTKNITTFDTALLAATLLAIFVWWQLNNITLAVIMVSLIDALIYIPTFRKSWEEPWSETISSWLLFNGANIANIAALNKYNFLTLVYLITIIICNFILIAICVFRRRKISNPEHSKMPK